MYPPTHTFLFSFLLLLFRGAQVGSKALREHRRAGGRCTRICAGQWGMTHTQTQWGWLAGKVWAVCSGTGGECRMVCEWFWGIDWVLQGWVCMWGSNKWLLRHGGSGCYQVGKVHKGAKSPRAAVYQETPNSWCLPTCSLDGKLSRGKAKENEGYFRRGGVQGWQL